MRNLQMFVGTFGNVWVLAATFFAGAATGGGAVYVFQEKQATAASAPANPLLTANRAAMLRLIPNYALPCGPIVFEDQKGSSEQVKERCVDQIKTNVWRYEQVRLTDADVLDPRVRTQWLAVVGGKRP